MSLDLFAVPAAAPPRVARVALPLPVDQLFDYAIPADLAAEAEVGCRVRVRALRRSLVGVIVAIAEAPEDAARALRPLEKVLDSAPAISPDLLGILRDEAADVLCPLGLALAAALPPGSAPRPAATFALTGRGREALRSGAARGEVRRLLERLAKGARGAALLRRAGFSRSDLADAAAEGLIEPGLREPRRRARARSHAPEGALPEAALAPPALTPEQATACAAIGAAIRGRESRRFLLHGVTGSGKTEVYLRGIAEALALGRQALVLVPEITLTHQIIGRLRARFGDSLAVLHSGLRPAERVAEWERLRLGTTPIAVGARSALFAPLGELGLVVLDEEHDGAYKNEEGFRYHARSLAERRARAAGCPLVLGSATPALETRRAAERGELRRLVLSHRIGGRPLPAVELVDLAKERAALPRGRKLILSRSLARALADVLGDGGQALLFLNRRGFSTQITCFTCGRVERCPDCDIALVFHADTASLRCHYCDHRAPPPERCAGCGSDESALLGVGTERVEEEVRARFPEARVARLDRDVASRRGATLGVLRALRERSVDVVVGTQMLAKGHDFPGVRLVGVVHADLGLHFPDFRAAERTFQLLTQVAGRAGRGGEPGRVVVQTWLPDHYALRRVPNHDYEGFYREELAQRDALGYPPCGSLARALVSAPELETASAAAEALAAAARAEAQRLAPSAGQALEVLGPAPAPLARLRGRHRVQLLVKGSVRAAVRGVAAAMSRTASALPRAVRAQVDADPYDML
jgi:primosomal protein N' (replication factor Y)